MQSTAITQPSVFDQNGSFSPNQPATIATGPEIGFRIHVYRIEPTTSEITLGKKKTAL